MLVERLMPKSDESAALRVYQFKKTNLAYFIYDPQTGHILARELNQQTATSELSVRSEKTAGWSLDEAMRRVKECRAVDEIYDPRRPSGIFQEGHDLFLNRYQRPSWRGKGGVAAGLFEEHVGPFIAHLFRNDGATVEEVHNWMRVVMSGRRNFLILCLLGEKGIGKGIFTSMLRGLVDQGKEVGHPDANFVEVRGNAFSAATNGQMEFKQIVHWNEAEIDPFNRQQIMANLKRFTEPTYAIRKMYREERTVENFASLVVSSNDESCLPPERNERRFWINDLADVPLIQSDFFKARFDDTKYTGLDDYIQKCLLSPAAIRALGQYLDSGPSATLKIEIPKTQTSRRTWITSIIDNLNPHWAIPIATSHELRIAKVGDTFDYHKLLQLIPPQHNKKIRPSIKKMREFVSELIDIHEYGKAQLQVPLLKIKDGAKDGLTVEVVEVYPDPSTLPKDTLKFQTVKK